MTGGATIWLRSGWLRSGAAAIALVAASGPAASQDAGGVNANVSVSQGFVTSSDDGTFGRTDLGFTLSSVTRTQDLLLRIDSGIEERFDDGFDTEFEDPRVNLSYGLESRQSALTVLARYQRSDVDELGQGDILLSDAVSDDPAPDDPLSDVLVLEDGKRERAGIALGYAFGREARFGGEFNTSYDTVSYTGTNSPDLVDLARFGADLTLRFEITPRITATLGYDFNETERTGLGRDVRNTQLRAGANVIVSRTLTGAVSLGLQSVESTDPTTGFVQDEDGVVFALNLRQERPNGALTFNLNSELTDAGRESNLSVGTSFDTRSGGAFSGRIGLTVDDDGTTNPLYQITYSDSLRYSSYSVSLNQGLTTSDLGQNALNTRLGLTYNRELSATTTLQSGVGYQTTDFSGSDGDTSRLDVTLGLARELSEDWSVNSRYTFSLQDKDQRDRATENELFVGLETNFGWRP